MRHITDHRPTQVFQLLSSVGQIIERNCEITDFVSSAKGTRC